MKKEAKEMMQDQETDNNNSSSRDSGFLRSKYERSALPEGSKEIKRREHVNIADLSLYSI